MDLKPMSIKEAEALNNDWQPTHDYLKLIRLKDTVRNDEIAERASKSGILLPNDEKQKRKVCVGLVVACGPSCGSVVTPGMVISFPEYAYRIVDIEEGEPEDARYEFINIREVDVVQIKISKQDYDILIKNNEGGS